MSGMLSRFMKAGILNSALGLSVIALAREALGLGHVLANVCGYAVGLSAAFVINRKWVFRHTGRRDRAFLRFIAVFALAYSANLIFLQAASLQWPEWNLLPHVAGMIVYTLISYTGSRYFAFRRS